MAQFKRKADFVQEGRKLVQLLHDAARQAEARHSNNEYIYDAMYQLNDALFAVTVPQEQQNLKRVLDNRAGIASSACPEPADLALETLVRQVTAGRKCLAHSGYVGRDNVDDSLKKIFEARKNMPRVSIDDDPIFGAP